MAIDGTTGLVGLIVFILAVLVANYLAPRLGLRGIV